MNGEQVYVDSDSCGSCKVSGGNSANLVVACLFLGMCSTCKGKCICRTIINVTVWHTFMVLSVSMFTVWLNVVLSDSAHNN